MNEQPPTGNVATHSFANKALAAAAVIAGVSVFVPGLVWKIGRWDVIYTASGIFCFASLVSLVCSILAVLRGPRGLTAYVASLLSALALMFWCFVIFVFVTLLRGGGE